MKRFIVIILTIIIYHCQAMTQNNHEFLGSYQVVADSLKMESDSIAILYGTFINHTNKNVKIVNPMHPEAFVMLPQWKIYIVADSKLYHYAPVSFDNYRGFDIPIEVEIKKKGSLKFQTRFHLGYYHNIADGKLLSSKVEEIYVTYSQYTTSDRIKLYP